MRRRFRFATGIENSYPIVHDADGSRRRVDQMDCSDHYRRWAEDLELVRALGADSLRWGPPYHRTHLGPGRYDWSFADAVLARMTELGIEPILDLCHFGVPDWLESFQNPDFPIHFADYADAVARRFPQVRLYTPVNEIFIAACFSAFLGWWNEGLVGDRPFCTAIKHLAAANLRAMQAILAVTPDPVFVQSESAEYFHPEDPDCLARAQLLNQRRFLVLDLTYGYPVPVSMYEYLRDNGWSRADYDWFLANRVRANCVMGTDYYQTNEHLVRDEEVVTSGEIFGYYPITQQYFSRYRLPVMHTETNADDPDAERWLRKQWANTLRLRQDGIPVTGFTWYSLTDQTDWDTALRENNGRVNPRGLYDLDRRIRPAGTAFARIVQQWRRLLDIESTQLVFGYGGY